MLVMNPAIQFMTYETIKRRILASYHGSQSPAWTFFAIGAVAKTIATALTYPLQLVQAKLRVRICILIILYSYKTYLYHTILMHHYF